MNRRDYLKYSALAYISTYTGNSFSKPKIVETDTTRNIVNVTDWADLVVNEDWTSAFEAAAKYAQRKGGGIIFIPAGTYVAKITLYDKVYWWGEGKGVSVITQKSGENRDIVISRDFDSLKEKGPLVNAPMNFGLMNLTIDGNYLNSYRRSLGKGDTTYNNKKGYGIKIIGSKFVLDVEINNCAEIGLYSEAVDYTGYDVEQDSSVKITGRVFGKEGIVFRGPADINIEHVYLGCVGWLATANERANTIVMSDIYENEPVSAMVTDETNINNKRYNGHHEFGILHLYANYNGYGYKAQNTGRIKGNHLICENCRGGVYLDKQTWGIISIIDCHNNGHMPALLKQKLFPFPDLDINCLQSISINAIVRRTSMGAKSYLALKASGFMHDIKLSYFSTKPLASNSAVALINSFHSTYDINVRDVKNDAITLKGGFNKVTVNASNVTKGSVVYVAPYKKKVVIPNRLSIIARNCDNLVWFDRYPYGLNIDILAELKQGQTIANLDPNAIHNDNNYVINVKENGKFLTIK
ncbi:hypothetical protein [Citrobacter braakii]|uniref:hypothetical protein n=1 Tax=Citrobacter braakii TaxID=57706 RepID=UPI0039B65FE3